MAAARNPDIVLLNDALIDADIEWPNAGITGKSGKIGIFSQVNVTHGSI